MEPRLLTVGLPAYKEEARLGSALEDVFGHLRRNGRRGRDGAPAAARLPDHVRVPVVDDASTDAIAALVRARPELPSNAADGAALPVILLMLVPDVEPICLAPRRGYQVAVVPIRWTDTRGLNPIHRRVPWRMLETA